MPRLYPLMLDLDGQSCVVVGGGPVAVRKARGLRAAGAAVTLVAPTFCDEARELAASGQAALIERMFDEADVRDALLVFAATDRADVNDLVQATAERHGALVNRADAGGAGDFQVPAVVERDGLVVAISTGGRGPAFAASLRRELERLLAPERVQLLDLYEQARAALHHEGRSTDAVSWDAVEQEPLLRLLREGRVDEARAALNNRLAPLEAR
ncbi:MAG: bifunctional precorrin-2 dehydrogenase/sirohydrochlorin ferrochelatase [Chloroflexi bacterium]|nr:bifunctional precorrin-2 dehydrogenase/sirohydrochlorin ferrochelatase [Chloroflexota bacterium]